MVPKGGLDISKDQYLGTELDAKLPVLCLSFQDFVKGKKQLPPLPLCVDSRYYSGLSHGGKATV